ncbi:MAG: hypothetical protein WCJ31_15225 [Planctomycetia bacterium]
MKTRIDDYRPGSDDADLPLFAAARVADEKSPAPSPAPAARATDPPTSHEAAEGAKVFAPSQSERILEALQLGPAGKTELWRRTAISDVAIARRCTDLCRVGRLVVVSEDGLSLTGNRERVYDLSESEKRRALK